MERSATRGYILVAPEWKSGFGGDYTYSEAEHDVVLQTLRELRRRYQPDSDRVLSAGTFDVATGKLTGSASPTAGPASSHASKANSAAASPAQKTLTA